MSEKEKIIKELKDIIDKMKKEILGKEEVITKLLDDLERIQEN